MSWYTADDARRDAARQADRQQAGLLDKAQSSKQVTGQDAAKPAWTATDEAMRWLNEMEMIQGGANGPTIKLRAAIEQLAGEANGWKAEAENYVNETRNLESVVSALRADRGDAEPSEVDHACRFAVWWAHKRKTFTTTRQAAWAAWNDARSKTPNGPLSRARDGA